MILFTHSLVLHFLATLLSFHQPVYDAEINVFTNDTLVPVTPCNPQKLFSPDDVDIQKMMGSKPTIPSKNPQYPRGLVALREYFGPLSFTDEALKGVTIRIRVAFLVTCEGKAGNFTLLTPNLGDYQPYAERLLKIVSEMPQNWIAGEYKSEKIDSYQVLTFTMTDGKLDKIMFR